MHANRRAFLKSTAAGVVSATAATLASTAPQDWNTNDMIFNCRQLISFASRLMTIKPGDILFTGTPHGVIFGKPKGEQVWLKPGDRVVCSVEKLGELAFSLA